MNDLNSVLLEGIVLKTPKKNSFPLGSTRYQKMDNGIEKIAIVVSITMASKPADNYFENVTVGKRVRIVGHLTSEGITAEHIEVAPAVKPEKE